MKKFLLSIPKTSVATVLGALIVYAQAKTLIDTDTSVFLSSLLVALGFSSNIAVSQIRKNGR